MTWISPNVPEEGVDVDKLLAGLGHRHPVKVEGESVFVWLSICSMHYWHNPQCHMCVAGHWAEMTEENRERLGWNSPTEDV